MKSADRRDAIAGFIQQAGYVRLDEVAERFGVSRMTVHRHVEALARQGMVRKLHGAVTVQPSALYESAYRFRSSFAVEEKRALADAALAYVEAGQAVVLGGSAAGARRAGRRAEGAPRTGVT